VWRRNQNGFKCSTVLIQFDPPVAWGDDVIKNAIFDPGSSHEIESLRLKLANQNLSPTDIDAVFCSHGHSDHVGAIGLFPQALHFVGRDINQLNEYREIAIKPSQMDVLQLANFQNIGFFLPKLFEFFFTSNNIQKLQNKPDNRIRAVRPNG